MTIYRTGVHKEGKNTYKIPEPFNFSLRSIRRKQKSVRRTSMLTSTVVTKYDEKNDRTSLQLYNIHSEQMYNNTATLRIEFLQNQFLASKDLTTRSH